MPPIVASIGGQPAPVGTLRGSPRRHHPPPVPPIRLDPFNVKTLPAGATRATYRDDLVRGLVLRVTPAGARSYAIVYSRHGRNQTYTLGSTDRLTLKQARDEARLLLARVALGEDPAATKAAEKRETLSVAGLVEQCVAALVARKRRPLRPSTTKQWEWLRDRVIGPTLGREVAARLTLADLRRWGASVERKRGAYVAHDAYRVLRRAFSWGVEVGLLAGTPFIRMAPPGAGDVVASDRVLSLEELPVLLQALDELPGAYSSAVRLLLLTMVRRESVLGLQLAEVDGLAVEPFEGEAPTWTVPAERSKSGRPHVVPLSPAAAAVIRQQREATERDGLLFAHPDLEGHMGWSSAYVADLRAKMVALHGAPIPRWTIHNLRHTAATHLREHLGADRDLVRLLLSHAPPPGATSIYDRAERLAERRQALDRWATWLLGLHAAWIAQRGAEAPSRGASGTRRRA